MSGNTYKIIELVGSSANSIDEALYSAVARAAQTLDHLEWFEVVQIRGRIENEFVSEFQVAVKLGLKVENVD